MDEKPVTRKVRRGPETCTHCGGRMPPVQPTGRIPIYCSDRCRKAAYEARRLRKPDAFSVKVVETSTTTEVLHPTEVCVQNVLASPWETRQLLVELARRINRDQVTEAEWITLQHAFDRLSEALIGRIQRTGGRLGYR